MGEVTEDILEGTRCDCCGVVIDGETPGHPRTCDECNRQAAIYICLD